MSMIAMDLKAIWEMSDQTADIELFADWPDVAANLAGIGVVLKEWVGLVAYYVMDRTDELFPAPQT